jgi:uncharacterized membrane protein
MRNRAATLRKLLIALACLAYPWLAHTLVEAGAQFGQPVAAIAAAGLPHASAYTLLLWLFARSLAPGRQPLVTRLARRVHGALPPQIEAYTRRVTLAWCGFFAGQLLASGLWLAFGSASSWSFLINVCNLPLVLAMFVGEYTYRVLRFRDFPHASFLAASRAFAKDASLGTGSAAR